MQTLNLLLFFNESSIKKPYGYLNTFKCTAFNLIIQSIYFILKGSKVTVNSQTVEGTNSEDSKDTKTPKKSENSEDTKTPKKAEKSKTSEPKKPEKPTIDDMIQDVIDRFGW